MPRITSRLKKQFFIIAGTIFLALGIIGIFLPVLPTTPFLLLTGICYMRGSQRLYTALLSNRIFGSYIKNYLEGRGMSWKSKILTLILLWIAIVCSAVFVTDSLVVRAILAAVLTGVTIHIVLIRPSPKRSSFTAVPCKEDRP